MIPLLLAALAVVAYLWLTLPDREPREEHRHDWERVGYGGAGWSALRCACGAKEIEP